MVINICACAEIYNVWKSHVCTIILKRMDCYGKHFKWNLIHFVGKVKGNMQSCHCNTSIKLQIFLLCTQNFQPFFSFFFSFPRKYLTLLKLWKKCILHRGTRIFWRKNVTGKYCKTCMHKRLKLLWQSGIVLLNLCEQLLNFS